MLAFYPLSDCREGRKASLDPLSTNPLTESLNKNLDRATICQIISVNPKPNVLIR